MTKTATKNFLGIPVSGTIVSGRSSVAQGTLEEFGPILIGALEAPGVVSLRWRQYTPYFNDGEPCEFNIYDITVKMDNTPEEAGDYEDGYVYTTDTSLKGGAEEKYDPEATYEYKDYRGNTSTRRGQWVKTGVVFPQHAAYEALSKLNSAVAGGRFYDVLLEAFGDHAIVTVTKDGIEVETYEHD